MSKISRSTSPRQEPTTRFTQLPDQLLYELDPRQHQLLHALLSHRWFSDSEIYPSVDLLSRMLGWSHRTVQRTMRRLEDGGYIIRVARFRMESEWGDRGQTSNRYEPGPSLSPLLPPPGDRPCDEARQDARRPGSAWPRKGEHEKHRTRSSGHQGQYIQPRTSGFLETRHGQYVPRST